jgi:hypothetical protein
MFMKTKLYQLALATLLAFFTISVMAIERNFPQDTKRGKLSVTRLADLVIDGKLRRIVPSTRIYNEEGLIVTTSALYSVNAAINYTENDFGDIERVWILTAAEASQKLVKNK